MLSMAVSPFNLTKNWIPTVLNSAYVFSTSQQKAFLRRTSNCSVSTMFFYQRPFTLCVRACVCACVRVKRDKYCVFLRGPSFYCCSAGPRLIVLCKTWKLVIIDELQITWLSDMTINGNLIIIDFTNALQWALLTSYDINICETKLHSAIHSFVKMKVCHVLLYWYFLWYIFSIYQSLYFLWAWPFSARYSVTFSSHWKWTVVWSLCDTCFMWG